MTVCLMCVQNIEMGLIILQYEPGGVQESWMTCYWRWCLFVVIFYTNLSRNGFDNGLVAIAVRYSKRSDPLPQILALNVKCATLFYIGYQHECLREQSLPWTISVFDCAADRHQDTACSLRIHCGWKNADEQTSKVLQHNSFSTSNSPGIGWQSKLWMSWEELVKLLRNSLYWAMPGNALPAMESERGVWVAGAEAWINSSNSSVYHSKELLNRLDKIAAKAGGEEKLSSKFVNSNSTVDV